jgi:hypothetical protein
VSVGVHAGDWIVGKLQAGDCYRRHGILSIFLCILIMYQPTYVGIALAPTRNTYQGISIGHIRKDTRRLVKESDTNFCSLSEKSTAYNTSFINTFRNIYI